MVTEAHQKCVPLAICRAIRMLAAVDLDDEVPLTADKVRVVGTDRLLANKFEAVELAVAQLSP